MTKGKDRIENDENKLDISTFVAVKATEVKDRFSPQGAALLPPDIAAAPDAAEYANTLIKVLETGKAGIFQHGVGETKFKKVPGHHLKSS